mgnify:CR=1 FL=1
MYYATFAQKIQYLSEFFDRLSLAMQRKDEKEEMKEENKKAAWGTCDKAGAPSGFKNKITK